MMKHPDQRVAVFVDVQNMYHSARNLFDDARVNFEAVLERVVAGRRLVRAVAYVVSSQAPEEQSFFEALEKAGIELRVKDIQVYAGGAKKADWDVGMAVDAIRIASLVDTIVLVTGDGDFVPLVEYLKWGLGRQVEVAAFGRSTSLKLKEATDSFINIENIPRIIIKK